MIRSTKVPQRVAAALAATAVVALYAAPASAAAVASDDAVDVVNTETIQVYTDATGKVDAKRVYEQLALTGHGSVDLANPIETDGLRNLDGFGGFEVKDGKQITRTTVDGEKHLRSVSSFDGDLPLEVHVTYLLDGKQVDPGDVVGKDGKLEVLYSVRNVTAAPQEVTFPDGTGGTVTKTVQVPIPIVGSLTTLAPENFTNVQSKQANMAGDGRGATKLSFTMTLFPPLGSDTAEFGYTADITDGVVPRADISALPVNPLESPTFASAATSYKGGADTGARLAEGATTIDENLLKLRDGAAKLLGGLIKLHEGSTKLTDGLAGSAVPGSHRLADGMGQLDEGVGRLDAGMGKISSGSDQLAAGATKASDGGRKLRDGAGRLSGGLGKLSGGALELDAGAAQILAGQKALRDGLKLLESGVDTLPATVRDQLAHNPQYQALLGGMQQVVDGIGDPSDVTDPATGQPATIFGGLNAIKYGLRHPAGYANTDCAGAKTRCGAMDGVQTVSDKLASAAAAGGDLDVLIGAAKATYTFSGCPALVDGLPPYPAFLGGTNPCKYGGLVIYGLNAPIGTELPLAGKSFPEGGVKQQSQTAADGLHDIYTKVDAGIVNLAIPKISRGLYNPAASPICAVGAATPTTDDDCGIKQAVAFFKMSIPVLVDGITGSIRQTLLAGISVPGTGCDPTAMTLLCGANALVAGSGDLKAGTEKLVAGSGELGAGGELLYDKLGELSSGLDRISDGAGRLADGAAEAKAGTGKLKDGSGQLADGANQLADGLVTAADGSRQITDGLGQASGGAPRLVDGAQRLSDEGTKKLVEAGVDTAQNYGEMYATLTAGAERAQTEKMAYGAPEGAFGLTAYSYVIKGENGEGGRNLARGLVGLGLLGAGAGAFALRRRFI